MCLIAHRSVSASGRGANIPNDVIEFNKRANPDGFGIAWRDSGSVKHKRFAPSDYDAFYKLLKKIDRQDNIEYVAHWRKATHGPICEEMSHPFKYDDKKEGEVLVFHNGIISNHPPKGESDTSHFVKTVLARIASRWWKNPAYQFLVEESIGWSRLLLMTDNETVRLNEKSWEKRNGIWYSTSPLPYSATKSKVTSIQKTVGITGDDELDDANEEAIWLEADEMEDLLADDSSSGWVDEGHWVYPLNRETDLGDRDVYGTARCVQCSIAGEYYLIDGRVFIEVEHKTSRFQTSVVPYSGNA